MSFSDITQQSLRFQAESAHQTPEISLLEIGYRPQNRDWNHPHIYSPLARLYYNRQPGHWIEFEGQRYALGPESLLFIPDHLLFHCCSQGCAPHLWLEFRWNLQLETSALVPTQLPLNPLLTEQCKRLQEALERPSVSAQQAWLLAMALLANALSGLSLKPPPTLPEKLEDLLATLEDELDGDCSNPSLAKRCGLSTEGFIRWFRQHTGTTPARYLTRLRIHEAARLLLESEASLEDIAERIGYPNRHYLSRVFRKHSGESPAAFRRRYRSALPGG